MDAVDQTDRSIKESTVANRVWWCFSRSIPIGEYQNIKVEVGWGVAVDDRTAMKKTSDALRSAVFREFTDAVKRIENAFK